MLRTLVMLLLVALLASLPGSAQCVLQCLAPAAPPPCHHHAPAKQMCSAAMLPADTRFAPPPAVLVPALASTVANVLSEPRTTEWQPLVQPVEISTHAVLRI